MSETPEQRRGVPLDQEDLRVLGLGFVSLLGAAMTVAAAAVIEPALAAMLLGAGLAVAAWRAI